MEVARRQTVRERRRLQQAARRQLKDYAEEFGEREKYKALAAVCPGHPLDEIVSATREMQANLKDRTHALRCLCCRLRNEWWFTAQQCADTAVNV